LEVFVLGGFWRARLGGGITADRAAVFEQGFISHEVAGRAAHGGEEFSAFGTFFRGKGHLGMAVFTKKMGVFHGNLRIAGIGGPAADLSRAGPNLVGGFFFGAAAGAAICMTAGIPIAAAAGGTA
jgi:hypothetical protein